MSNTPFTIYGYQITVPEDDTLDFIHDIISINDTLVEPIQIYCITPSPSSHEVQVILGFIPNDLSRIMFHVDALREFIMDNPMFDGIHMSEKPTFYAGFTWKREANSEAESEADSETNSETDSETNSETDSEADSETDSDEASQDNDSSDSDDISDRIDKTDDKPISYYISKYYI